MCVGGGERYGSVRAGRVGHGGGVIDGLQDT